MKEEDDLLNVQLILLQKVIHEKEARSLTPIVDYSQSVFSHYREFAYCRKGFHWVSRQAILFVNGKRCCPIHKNQLRLKSRKNFDEKKK